MQTPPPDPGDQGESLADTEERQARSRGDAAAPDGGDEPAALEVSDAAAAWPGALHMTLLERLEAAADLQSRAALLERLSRDEHLGVREAVARNPAATLPVLLRLSGWFPQAVLRNATFARLVQEDAELPQRLPESALVALLRQPEVPQSWLLLGAQHASFWVRHAVAQHPSAPMEALQVLAGEPGLRAFLARNPSLPAPLLSRLSQDADPQVREAVAVHPGTSDSTRAWLLQDRAPEVRRALAGNPRCEPGLLGQLAADEESVVRQTAARNPAMPRETLELLTRAGCAPDLGDVLELGTPDPTLEPEVLAWLSQGGFLARLLAARHPNTPADALVLLRADSHAEVRRHARRGTPSLPPFAARGRGLSLRPQGGPGRASLPPLGSGPRRPPEAPAEVMPPSWLSSAPTMLMPRAVLPHPEAGGMDVSFEPEDGPASGDG